MLYLRRKAFGRMLFVSMILALCCSAYFQGKTIAADDTDKFSQDLDPKLQAAIATTIQNGVDKLLARQKDDGTWKDFKKDSKIKTRHPNGETILILYTLLSCGVPATDPRLEKTFAFLRKQTLVSTYERGLMLMALHAKFNLHAKWHQEWPKKKSVQAKACQNMSADDKLWMETVVKQLLSGQKTSGWSYLNSSSSENEHSNIQFALLGLMAAADCGIDVPESVWLTHLEYFVGNQSLSDVQVKHVVPNEDTTKKGKSKKSKKNKSWSGPGYARGWGYFMGTVGREIPATKTSAARTIKATTTKEENIYGSMTCVGISSLQICRQQLIASRSRKYTAQLDKASARAIEDGVTWLEHNFSVKQNPKRENTWPYYYLYSLERVGMLLDRTCIGKNNWYEEGAKFLVSSPVQDGYYPHTCFALLFLSRASAVYQK